MFNFWISYNIFALIKLPNYERNKLQENAKKHLY